MRVTVAGVPARGLDPAALAAHLAAQGAHDPAVVLYPEDGELGVVTQWSATVDEFLNVLYHALPKSNYIVEVEVDETVLRDWTAQIVRSLTQPVRRACHCALSALR